MVSVQNIVQMVATLDAILGHFVTYTASAPTLSADFEWNLPTQTTTLTSKGHYLLGAVADIVTYGAILVDWMVQALLGNGINANSAPI